MREKTKKVIFTMILFSLILTMKTVSSYALTTTKNMSPTNFKTNVSQKTIGVKGKYKIYVKNVTPKKANKSVTFYSKNKKIATVNKQGIITGKKIGKTKIVVQSKKNKKLKKTVTIRVKNLKPTKLKLNTKEVKVKYGTTYQLKTSVYPSTMYCSTTFYSKNNKIATVNKYGKIKGKKEGTTTIVVRTNKKNSKGKYLYQNCKVTVSHNYKLIKTVKSTCTERGYKEYKCNYCRKTYRKTIEKSQHQWQIIEELKPSCENDGYKIEKCKICGKEKTQELRPTGHNYGVLLAHKDATCQDEGYDLYRCKICGARNEIIYPVVDHSYIMIEEKQSTCIESGYKKYQCKYCGKTYTQVLDKSGHDWEVIEEKTPSCENDGYKKEKCKICGEIKNTELKAIGHDYSIAVEKKEATNQEDGYIVKKCSLCGNTTKEILTKDKTYTIEKIFINEIRKGE